MTDDEHGERDQMRDVSGHAEGTGDGGAPPPPVPRSSTPARYAWEQALLDDYSEHRWHVALDPLAVLFARWSAGEVEHLEVSRAITRAHGLIEEDFLFFSDRRATLVALIQQDRDWYESWLASHPEPTES